MHFTPQRHRERRENRLPPSDLQPATCSPAHRRAPLPAPFARGTCNVVQPFSYSRYSAPALRAPCHPSRLVGISCHVAVHPDTLPPLAPLTSRLVPGRHFVSCRRPSRHPATPRAPRPVGISCHVAVHPDTLPPLAPRAWSAFRVMSPSIPTPCHPSRLSPRASRLSPLASRLSPLASRLVSQTVGYYSASVRCFSQYTSAIRRVK